MPSVHVIKGIIGSVSKQANTILATLRENFARADIMTIVQELSDIPLRTQDIGRTINVIDKARQDWNRMKFTRRDSIIRQGYSEVTKAGKKRFATIIESDTIDLVTGAKETRYSRIYHDDFSTREAIESEARDMLDEQAKRYDFEIIAQRPVQGFVFR